MSCGCRSDAAQVVAVEGDVQAADRDAHALVGRDDVGDALRERDAASLDAHERQAAPCRRASRRSRGRCARARGGPRRWS